MSWNVEHLGLTKGRVGVFGGGLIVLFWGGGHSLLCVHFELKYICRSCLN
jgi:hypothetical protein